MSDGPKASLFTDIEKCKLYLGDLADIVRKDDVQGLSPDAVEDELGRFRVWAGIIGIGPSGDGLSDTWLESQHATDAISRVLSVFAEILIESKFPGFPGARL